MSGQEAMGCGPQPASTPPRVALAEGDLNLERRVKNATAEGLNLGGRNHIGELTDPRLSRGVCLWLVNS